MLRYFNYSEFDSPDVQGSGQMMDKRILEMLDEVRDKFDKPIHINSGFRTPAHNEEVGGVETSSHLKGLAVDIACKKSTDRFDLINCLLDVGFSRIGVAKTFIHADIDQTKAQGVIWTY
jgi:uncharacterized protein YcbK (DUF882 family)